MTTFAAGRGSIARPKVAPVSFTPANLPGLVHWWHAVDSPKTGSPGDISQLNDRIGTVHLIQPTPSVQPDDNTRTINGKVCLEFDAGDGLSVASGLNVSNNGTAYGFFIAKFDALVNGDYIFFTGGDSAANDGFALQMHVSFGSTGRLSLVWANGTTLEGYHPTTPIIGTSVPHLLEFWVIGTTGGVNFAVDGTTAVGAANTVGYAGPEECSIMSRAATLNQVDGAFCEAGLCNAVPVAANRTNLLNYARSYWGVT